MARILVVDDRVDDRSLLVGLLGSAGHEVLSASEGATALAVARRHQPDLVITDLLLPFMDGYEFVRSLRSSPETTATKVIIYSAHYDASELEEFARVEVVQSVVTKPVRPDRFLELVATCLAQDLPARTVWGDGFDEHLRLISHKLMEKVEALETANAEVRRLLDAVVSAQERERARIAREVHDDPIQVLTASQLRAEILRATLREPEQIAAADQLAGTLTEAVARLRRLLWNLEPPRLDLGLADALEASLRLAFIDGSTTWDLESESSDELDEATRLVAFRIGQEAIANVTRHARASHVTVRVADHDSGVLLRVNDDGVGFDPVADSRSVIGEGHIGLLSMRERAELAGGWLRVRSNIGEGTVVEAWLPHLDPLDLYRTA